MRDFPRVVKICLVGNPSTGKSSLVHRFVYDRFSVHYQPTTGLEVYEKATKLSDNAPCVVQIWDISGSMLHARGLPNALVDADAVLLVYDTTQPASFKSVQQWLQLVERVCGDGAGTEPEMSGGGGGELAGLGSSDAPHKHKRRSAKSRIPLVAMVGTKSDLAGLRMVSPQIHLQFAEEHDLLQYTVSGRVAESVYSMFLEIASRLLGTAKDDNQAKNIARRLSVASLVQLTSTVTGAGKKKRASVRQCSQPRGVSSAPCAPPLPVSPACRLPPRPRTRLADPDPTHHHHPPKLLAHRRSRLSVTGCKRISKTTLLPIHTAATTTMSERKAIIKNADMSEEMQQDAVDCATQAMEKYNIEKDVAAFIKREFDKKYNPTWHCVVGRNFGSYVTHETKHFIYFYLGQIAILLFKSG
ncbi:hypothetical protein H9P43_007612 [Blastocladiella emersonii ATCC 22665]|nr:hypothetical protein H9P43_007612 [Blastocladiella emersonii ATCC 22665]